MDSWTGKTLEENKTIKAAGAVLALSWDENDGRSKIFTDWVRYVRGAGVEEGVNLPPQGIVHLMPTDGEIRVLPWENLSRHMECNSGFRFGICGDNVFVTTGNFSGLQVGDHLYLGPALLVITAVGKNCDRKCGFSGERDEACLVSKSWIFANVIRGGQVCVDDPFIATCCV